MPLAVVAALLLSPRAAADPVDGGLQAALFPPGLTFIEDLLAGYTYVYDPTDVGMEVGCYDRIGIRDLELEIPIRAVELEPRDGSLAITVRFDSIYAEDLYVYAEDTEYTDACIEFTADVDYVQLDDAVLQLAVDPTVHDGQLALDVVGAPTLSGDLDTDIAWFPDDIALYYFEDMLLELIADEVGELLPGIVAEYAGGLVYGDTFGEFRIDVDLAGASVSRDALGLRADPTVAWTGTDGCPQDRDPGSAGANPTLDFGDGDGSTAAVGVTEGMVDELFLAAWRDGYFCFTEDNVADFLALVAGAFDPSVASLEGTASVGEPPRVTIDTDGVHFALDDVAATVTGEVDGQRDTLLDVRGGIEGVVELGIDPGLAAFTLSVRALSFDVDQIDASHLASDAGGEEALARFVEEWAGGWVASKAQDIALFGSLYWVWGYAVRVDRIDFVSGGAKLYLSLFAGDDPAVDRTPPDTAFELADAGPDFVELHLLGHDDRAGTLAYSVQVGEGAWSAWDTDDTYRIDGLPPGVTHIAVASRDGWLNVDPTPAEQWLEVGATLDHGTVCACGQSDASAALLVALGGLAAARRRRR